MKNLKIIITVFILGMITTNAQIKPDDIDKIIADEMVRQNLPGLAIGVYQNGKINYTKGYGFIDINNKKPITSTTPFRWASISKTITAIAAFQVDEKYQKYPDVAINDQVIEHYQHWTSKVSRRDIADKDEKSKITIKHLLTHTSGIQQYGDKVWANRENYVKVKNKSYNANSSVNVFREFPLGFNSGTKKYTDDTYTTQGYILLGAVVDKITGSYTDWVTKNIKNKLGLTSLKVSNGNSPGFKKKSDGIISANVEGDKEWVLPGGGWESNVKDLLKFARGINDGIFLKNTEKLWSNGGKLEYNGLESTGKGNTLRVWHAGTHKNLKTLMYIMPNKNISVVVMIPVQYASAWNVVRKIIHKMGIDRSSHIVNSPKDKCGKGTGMGSSKKKFVGVWRKTSEDVIIRRGYTSANFKKEWDFLSSQGYHLENFKFSDNLWSGIFKKGSGKYAMWRNYDQDGFNKKWKEMNSKGYRLYDIETYTIRGKRKWAGLFKKGTSKYAMYRNYSTKDFAAKRKEIAKGGLKLIDIEVYRLGSKLKWSGVWIEGKDGLLNRNYTYTDFKNLVQKRADTGYKLIDIETYEANGGPKWAGIWEKSTENQEVSFGLNYCDFMAKHDKLSGKSIIEYELKDLETY